MAALMSSGAGALALLEVLDRDGQARQAQPVHHWPLRIGRALDNDLVLADPHVAPHHAAIEPAGEGLELVAGQTHNGLHCGPTRLSAGERLPLRAEGEPPELLLGRTRLRLRLPGHALAPELPLPVTTPPLRRGWPWATIAAALIAFGGLGISTWLDADPDTTTRALGGMLTSALVGIAVWCGAWALLTKTFTGRSRFGWHLRVLLTASAAWGLTDTASELLAFSLSWPWLSDFAFIAGYAIAAAALYGHLTAVEPARPKLLRGVALAAFLSGTALSLWFQQQRQERFGSELYMSHLFPPALRLARPVPSGTFIDGLATLQAPLDRRAQEPPNGARAGDDDGL